MINTILANHIRITMEIPYNGRAIITEQFDHVEIRIPASKNWFIILFLGAWLCGWLFGEITVISSLLGNNENGAPYLFMAIWLCGWTVGGAFALRTFWWQIAGKEIIKVGQGALSITRNGALFVRPKTYDLREVKNFRVQDDNNSYHGFIIGSRNRSNPFNLGNTGTIRFDYGMKSVNIGNGLDEAEANYILKQLRSKNILRDSNFK